MIKKKRYNAPMAKFHELKTPVILAGSYGDAEDTSLSSTLYSVEDEDDRRVTKVRGVQW